VDEKENYRVVGEHMRITTFIQFLYKNGTMGGEVSITRRPRFNPRKIAGTHY
jgi:hypothetical protein